MDTNAALTAAALFAIPGKWNDGGHAFAIDGVWDERTRVLDRAVNRLRKKSDRWHEDPAAREYIEGLIRQMVDVSDRVENYDSKDFMARVWQAWKML